MTDYGPADPPPQELWWAQTDFALRNVSHSECTLSGWPELTFRGDATVVTCAQPCDSYPDKDSALQQRQHNWSRNAKTFFLSPGEHVEFGIKYISPIIAWHPAYRVDIRVPGDPTPLVIVLVNQAGVALWAAGDFTVAPFGETA